MSEHQFGDEGLPISPDGANTTGKFVSPGKCARDGLVFDIHHELSLGRAVFNHRKDFSRGIHKIDPAAEFQDLRLEGRL